MIRIQTRNKCLRHPKQLGHMPSGKGKGRWQSLKTLWASKMKGRRLRRIAAASRRRNRA